MHKSARNVDTIVFAWDKAASFWLKWTKDPSQAVVEDFRGHPAIEPPMESPIQQLHNIGWRFEPS